MKTNEKVNFGQMSPISEKKQNKREIEKESKKVKTSYNNNNSNKYKLLTKTLNRVQTIKETQTTAEKIENVKKERLFIRILFEAYLAWEPTLLLLL